MVENNAYPLDAYQELEPLCDKGHVLLVQNREDGQLYVKKRIQSYAPELYRLLLEEPVAKTPRIYGIYPDPEPPHRTGSAAPLILIEEYLPGHTLAEHLRDHGPFSEEEVLRIGLELCGILRELHSRRPAIIHRDIKPANVMLLPDGSVGLLDFSASKLEAVRESRDTVLMGTAGFAAPEQYGFSSSTPQTDLYSMGVLLNTLRTGALPWEKRAGGRLSYVIGRCLKLDPKDRFADARELRAALKRVQRERYPWLPPGFRSLCWYKMLPAACYYLLFLAVFTSVSLKILVAGEDPRSGQIVLITAGLFPIVFFFDFLNIQRYFPFLKSTNRWVRLVGYLLFPLWLWIFLLLTLPLVS